MKKHFSCCINFYMPTLDFISYIKKWERKRGKRKKKRESSCLFLTILISLANISIYLRQQKKHQHPLWRKNDYRINNTVCYIVIILHQDFVPGDGIFSQGYDVYGAHRLPTRSESSLILSTWRAILSLMVMFFSASKFLQCKWSSSYSSFFL